MYRNFRYIPHAELLSIPSPQTIRSRIVESYTNYSTVEVTWEPLGNDSRVDFYHYFVIVDSEDTSYSLYDVKTTNTTAILSILPYDVNITFFLSASNSCGGNSTVVYEVIGKCWCSLNL